ncbi:hypothetical protein DFO68_10243 [Halomonas ventosae]|uniref:Uncharacterized protein n=1 Tax=Halomonas ventosae TaxID=229007 RepID=A0A4R6I129_9GAMM|nr:hypothetical protein DFO68_10243 [Halomonas ventosae]
MPPRELHDDAIVIDGLIATDNPGGFPPGACCVRW